MTKIVLPKVLQNFEKTPKSTCWPKDLNQKGFRVTYNTGRDQTLVSSGIVCYPETFLVGSPLDVTLKPFWLGPLWMLPGNLFGWVPFEGSPLDYFGTMRLLFKIFFHQRVPLQFFWSFATEWMLKNPKGSSLSVCFGIVTLFSFFFLKRLPIHQYFDLLKSFCYF